MSEGVGKPKSPALKFKEDKLSPSRARSDRLSDIDWPDGSEMSWPGIFPRNEEGSAEKGDWFNDAEFDTAAGVENKDEGCPVERLVIADEDAIPRGIIPII